MTIKEPQEEALLTEEAAFAPAKLAPPSTSSQRPAGTDAPRRAPKPDYRLRGLDLDADAFVEATPRQVRKRHPTRLRRRRRLVLQWTVVLLLLAATAGFLRLSVLQPYAVRSTAMVPTLKPGTNVLVLRPTSLRGSLKTGDLVVFHRPDGFSCSNAADSTNTYLKRVIGLAGPDHLVSRRPDLHRRPRPRRRAVVQPSVRRRGPVTHRPHHHSRGQLLRPR